MIAAGFVIWVLASLPIGLFVARIFKINPRDDQP